MDFFEQQHSARRKTGLMLLLFVLAVAAIVAVLNLVGVAIYIWLSPKTLYSANLFAEVPRYVYGWSTAVILAVIAGGTTYRLYQLSGGAWLSLRWSARATLSATPPSPRSASC